MKTTVFFLAFALFAAVTVRGQAFEERAKTIAEKIEAITAEEKAALKDEVEAVNVRLDKKEITNAEADALKLELAEKRAKNIENRVASAEAELTQLVKDKVDGKIKEVDTTRKFVFKFDTKAARERREKSGERRTTSQFVFALGFNQLETDQSRSVAHSDYKVWGSYFYEWGLTWNTRILKDANLLHAKYGVSLMYNDLRPTENRIFVIDGDQTGLADSPIHLEDSKFRNVHLVVPVHLEFDFTRKKVVDDRTIFRTHKGFRMGIGGYGGVNIKSKQKLRFEDEDGNNVKQKTKGDFNVNDFTYGVSAYLGYGEVSLYAKYDLNPLFKDNAADQNNVSLGLRFDLN
jgi:hypothetical protein